MANSCAVSPAGARVAGEQEPDREPQQTFDELGVLGVDGFSKRAQRVYHAPRGFEKPTETFVRNTGMRDRGPPGYEYNNTEHLSVSATAKPGSPG